MALFSNKNQPRKVQTEGRRSALTSYYRSDQSPAAGSPFAKKTAKKPARRYLFGLLDIVLICLVLAGVGYSLMVSSNPKINASDLSFHSRADYQSAAAAQLSRLSNRNKITFNQQSLAAALQMQFPEISAVSVELPLLSQKPTIDLTIPKASFTLSGQGGDYIVNAVGKAVARAAQLPKNSSLPTIQDSSGYQINDGSQVLSADNVSFINTLLAECQRAKVPIASLTLPAVPQELDLRTKDQPYFVKFYLGGDALTETGQFLAARQRFKNTSQTPSQYLDVRVAGKVFYK